MIVKIEFKLLYSFVRGKRWVDKTSYGLFFDAFTTHTSYDDPNMQIGDIVDSWSGSREVLLTTAFKDHKFEVERPFDPDANIWTHLVPAVSA